MVNYAAKFFRISRPSDGVLLVELSRPPANAFHEAAWRDLQALFEQITFDGEVRVVVLASASDKFFSAGLDLNAKKDQMPGSSTDAARKAFGLRQHVSDFQDAITSIEKCNQPVIVAMNGYVLGLGIDIACAGDIRYCSSDVKFSIKEIDIGMAADIGSLARLPKITGNESLTRELALTGRIFDAAEAQKLGFVSKIVEGGRVDVVKSAIETAVLIASKSPVAVVGTKHLLLHARDHSVQHNLDYTATWNSVMLQTEDLERAQTANKKKQASIFKTIDNFKGKL